MSQREGQNIFIKTFGGFDVFVDGKQVHFSSEKAKEMLAVLVDKRGSSVSLSQMAWLLYEQSPEQTAKNNLRVIYYRLKKILENNGIGGMLIKKRGSFAGSSAIIRIIHPSHTLVLLLKVLCCISHT